MRGPVHTTIQAGSGDIQAPIREAPIGRFANISSFASGIPELIRRPVRTSIRFFHRYREERMVSENEQRSTVGPAKDDVDGTLGHVDLAD